MSHVSDILENLDYGVAPESAQLAEDWLKEHGHTFGHFIGGQWVAAESTFATTNPATGLELAQIGQGTETTVNQAVEAARTAFASWSGLPGAERAKYLYAIARQIQKHARLFAVLESMDNGKPIRETRDVDVPLVARHFYYHAGWATLAEQEYPHHRAVGVCGQIIPWNFPLLMLAWKIAPALAMGNTVVLKPAEFTSLTALLFAEICQRVGLPAGVVNIVTGDGDTGKALVAHANVDKIAFTGSTEVGKHIRRSTAGSHKKLSLELGGKSPYIVFDDADMDAAVEGLVDAIWFNQGQVCCAGSRLLVQESIAEEFYARVRRRMAQLRVGDPLDKATDIGAVVDTTQLERIHQLVEQGVAEGATKFQPECTLPAQGCFYPPTLLTGVEPASTVAQVEIFGPVLVAMTFRTPSEAVALANNTVYGLAGTIFSQNLDIAHDVAAQVKAGVIWINGTNFFDASVGFGGYKESGFGREGGREGLEEYLVRDLPTAAAPQLPVIDPLPDTDADMDRTHKLYIGGKQVRTDSGYSLSLPLATGGLVDVSRGNRKDIRNAVEAAEAAASAWASTTAFTRAQILYYLAENMQGARHQLVESLTARGAAEAEREFDATVHRVLHWAAWADKYEGTVHQPPLRAMVYTRPESLGVMGVICPEAPALLGFVSACLPAVAMGNAVVAIPSVHNPLPALELFRILEASDIPAGVWNIVTGLPEELESTLASHDGVMALWHFGTDAAQSKAELESAGNLKQMWTPQGPLDWHATPSTEWLRRATQVKNIWVPYGA